MRRTTIMMQESQWLALKEVAEREGRSPSEVIREAVATYVTDRRDGARPSFVGSASGRQGGGAGQAEALLGEG